MFLRLCVINDQLNGGGRHCKITISIVINDKQIDVVSHAKILGVNISSDLKWNHHISEVVKKATILVTNR